MKKLLSVLLAISLVFVFAACGGKDSVSQTSAPTEVFVKPANYSTVVTVTINPQFNLYLNDASEVLAVEPVNDDAKSIADGVKTIAGTLETVINDIVTASNAGGFVKENADVKFEITEKTTNSVNDDDVLNSAKKAAEKVADNLNLTINVQVSIAVNITNNNNTTINNTTINNNVTINNSSTIEHHHVFSEATCTEPKKCTCGATEGKALGHKYEFGECTRCKAKDPNYKTYTRISSKNGEWEVNYIASDGCLYQVSFTLCGLANEMGISYGIGDSFDSLPKDFQDEINGNASYANSLISFEGKKYYIGRGSGDGLGPVQEFGNSVTINDLEGAVISLERTGENTLTVKQSPASFSELGKIPTGKTLTFKAK